MIEPQDASKTWDVLVIGGGPAGGGAALNAAKLGLSTIVLEEHKDIGLPVHCGECLSGLAVTRLGEKPPAEAIALDVKGIRVLFPPESNLNFPSSTVTEPGYVLEKEKFEQWVLQKAQSFGAVVRTGAKVMGLQRNGAGPNATWTVTVGIAPNQTTLTCKIVLDASGSQSAASRLLNLNPLQTTVIGLQYELQDIPNDGWLDFYLWQKYAPGGYLWMIPKANGRANVGLVTDQKAKAKPLLDAFIKEMKWETKTIRPRNPGTATPGFGGLIPGGGPVPNTFTDGLMLIGDAAGFTSPMFEGGSSLSLTSGRFAAQVAKKALDKNDASAAVLSEYKTLWTAEFPDYNKLIEGKHLFYTFTDEELNTVGKLLPKEIGLMGPLDKAAIGAKLVTKPALVAKGAVTALLSLGYSRAKYYGW